ncbi:DUF4350 domain-containing protein [Arthrobacter sp. H14]|uniref:DUF4350 domain-containing protein n=1 Tax=Arthrobacter sp. H14 TaxID=1312959 RepID=UPI0004AEAE8F|nr:DUF4350 domain-containing protein [Arthrobacter sp. H14]
MNGVDVRERSGDEQTGPPQAAPVPSEFSAGGSTGQTLAALFRKWKFWILIAAATVVVLVLSFIFSSGGSDRGILSPGNSAPNGAMAAAQILEEQGVEVIPTETLTGTIDALRGPIPGETTLLIHDRLQLLMDQQLARLSETKATVVLLEPTLPALESFAPEINSAGVVPTPGDEDSPATLKPRCSLEDPVAAGPIDRGGSAYRGGQMCYFVQNEQAGASASYVQSEDGRVTVIGNPAIMSNAALPQYGNAALTLRTLGANPTLIWYQPSLTDIAFDDAAPSVGELVPPWVNLTMVWLFIVALLGIIWKSRRTGPLVLEPLPVTAKAAETAEGRARLYQDSRAFRRAAGNLRAGTLTRLATHFRLGSGADAEAVARAASEASTLPESDVGRILLREQPDSDAGLLHWAQELETLEKEVTAR